MVAGLVVSVIAPTYMTDLVDRSLFETTPVVVAPSRSPLPELAVGGARYLVTNDGLKIEARSNVLRAVMALSRGLRLPYGEVADTIELRFGPIPTALLKEASEAAISVSPNEWAGWIYWDRSQMRYRLWDAKGPRVSASPGSIRYELPSVDPLDVVFDLHSHGEGPAFFSGVDDEDDSRSGAGLEKGSGNGTSDEVSELDNSANNLSNK